MGVYQSSSNNKHNEKVKYMGRLLPGIGLFGNQPEQKPIDRITDIDELLRTLIQESRTTNSLLTSLLQRPAPVDQENRLFVPGDNSLSLLTERLGEFIDQQQSGKSVNKEFFYFTYPADGTKKTIGIGKTVFDFYNGIVKLPDGTTEYISDSLKKHNLDPGSIHAMAIGCDKAAKYSLDNGGYKPITATDFQTERNLGFTTLVLDTTVNTPTTVWASTNPDAFFGKLGANVTGGIVNTYEIAVDPNCEFGDPAGDIGYYTGVDQTYKTLSTYTVGATKYGVLHEVSMTYDLKARYKLTIGGTVKFTDKQITAPYSMVFPPNKLAAGTVILLEVKSVDGTNILVSGGISLKEVSTS